jgi:hypothetical protein
MELSRRDLAAGGVIALAAAALGTTAFVGSARAEGDEAVVKKLADELRVAQIKQDKAKLEALTAPQLTYSHSDGRVEDKAQYINGVMTRKATVKSLEWPDLTIQVIGNTAVVRHLWVSESELDGKTTNTKIGVMQVWQKQGTSWTLLARASFRLGPAA